MGMRGGHFDYHNHLSCGYDTKTGHIALYSDYNAKL
jgi:hypothetical protein